MRLMRQQRLRLRLLRLLELWMRQMGRVELGGVQRVSLVLVVLLNPRGWPPRPITSVSGLV